MAPSITPRFLSQLKIENLGQGLWRLVEDLRYQSAVLGARLTIPAGFKTDLSTVPRLPVTFWLFGDTAHAAAVIHDFLYAVKIITRAQADAVFLEAMESSGIPAWRRWPMYLAVRAFGEIHWQTRAPVQARPGALVASSMGEAP